MAKLKTHYIFSMGIVAPLFTYLKTDLILFVPGFLTVFLTDTAIDLFGHRKRPDNPHIHIRSRFTHSILTAPLWGIGVGYLVAVIAKINPVLPVIAGFMASICHLFADSLTEGGIYFPRKRHRLLSLPYNHKGINLLLVLLGVSGFIYAFLSLIKLAGGEKVLSL